MPAPRRILAVLLICSLVLTGACSSMKTIDTVTVPARTPFGKVKAGDTVVVHLNSGERHRFVVRQVDGDHLVAENGTRFSRGEITRLERRSFSGPKTALLVGGIVVAWIIVALAAAYADLLGGWQ